VQHVAIVWAASALSITSGPLNSVLEPVV
jgi:hypothetical protein